MDKINIRILEDKKDVVKVRINVIKKEVVVSEVRNVSEGKLEVKEEILDEEVNPEGPEFTEDELLNEEWRSLSFFGYPNHSVSDLSRIRNNMRNKLVTGTLHGGYRRVKLSYNWESKNLKVHNLVALAFLGNPGDSKITVDHINCKETLNNRVTNLRWATKSEQTRNRDTPNMKGNRKSVKQSQLDGTLIKIWSSQVEIVTSLVSLGITRKCLYTAIKSGYRYKGFLWSKLDVINLDNEEWKPITNSGGYQVSNRGRLLGKTGELLNGSVDKYGYLVINIKIDGVLKYKGVHTLVAKAFLPESNLPIVNHKDGDKLDNDVDNLEFTTDQRNTQHAFDMGLNKGPPRVKVGKYDMKTGEELEKFESMTKAQASIEKGEVKHAIDNPRRSAGGFRWRRI